MGSLISPGTTAPLNIVFNNAFLDIQVNSGDPLTRLCAVDELKCDNDKKVKDVRGMGSQMALAKFVTDFTFKVKLTVNSINMALGKAFWLPSNTSPTVVGSGFEYDMYDGQPATIQTLAVTGYAGAGNTLPLQLQYVGVVITKFPIDFKLDMPTKQEIEFEAIKMFMINQLATQ